MDFVTTDTPPAAPEPYVPTDSVAGKKNPLGLCAARGWDKASTDGASPVRSSQANPSVGTGPTTVLSCCSDATRSNLSSGTKNVSMTVYLKI